jgi:hypothetical protein
VKDALLLIAGAVLGLIVDRLWDVGREAHQRSSSQRRAARRQQQDDALRSSLLRLYKRSGMDQNLYLTTTFKTAVRTSLLHDATLGVFGPLDGRTDEFVSVIDSRRVEFPSNIRVIKTMRRAGAQLWDGSLLYAKEVESMPGARAGLHVGAGVCNYFAYVTERDRIRRTLDRRRRSGCVPSDLRTTLASRPTPTSLAASVVCVFQASGGREVAIQRRSPSVVSATGKLGVIPLFGLESNRDGTTRSRYGALAYNFLKEFMEEFYDVEELTQAASSAKLHPDWIFDIPITSRVVDEFDAGRLRLRVLGVGFDLRDASLTYALLAHFESPAYLERLKSDLKPSSESKAQSAAEKPINFLPLAGEELTVAAATGQFDSSSVFALDLARAYYGLTT